MYPLFCLQVLKIFANDKNNNYEDFFPHYRQLLVTPHSSYNSLALLPAQRYLPLNNPYFSQKWEINSCLMVTGICVWPLA